MATPEGANENWDFLFEIEVAAGIADLARPAALCFRCKCSHGCKSLVAVRDVIGAQFWSVYVPTTTAEKGTAVRDTLEQIDSIKQVVKAYSDTLEIALSASDIARINMDGKFASLIGVEGGHSIDNSLSVLRMLRDLGVRYMTLTRADILDQNDSDAGSPPHDRLAPFAEEFVKEMNRLGMLVDISHLPPESMKHVVRASRSPVVVSNMLGIGVAEKGRKMPNAVFDLIKKSSGVIMVNFYSDLLIADGRRIRKDLCETARELRRKYPDDKDYRTALER